MGIKKWVKEKEKLNNYLQILRENLNNYLEKSPLKFQKSGNKRKSNEEKNERIMI